MLLDDQKRMVEIVVDNIMRGNVRFNEKKMDEAWNSENMKSLINRKIARWCTLRSENLVGLEFERLTKELAADFVVGRICGYVDGEMKDNDVEKRIKELENDNKILATQYAEVKNKLDELTTGKPVNEDFMGFG